MQDRIRHFAQQLQTVVEDLRAMYHDPGNTAGNDERTARLNDLAARQQALAGLAEAIISDSELTAREAPAYPQLLREYQNRLTEAHALTERLHADAWALQDALDEAHLTKGAATRHQLPKLTRGEFAREAAGRLAAMPTGGARLQLATADSINAALAAAAERAQTVPQSTLVLFSDGCSPLRDGDRDLARRLEAAGVLIYTVLVGRDGAVPDDAGIAAVDMPSVAVKGAQITARILVKNQLEPGRPATIELRESGQLLATESLDPDRRDIAVIQLRFAFPAAGRRQVVAALRTGEDDAYPGNEVHVQTVDVLPAPARVVLLADRVTAEFAAYRQALAAMPAIEFETVLLAPNLGDPDQSVDEGGFPTARDAWEGITLAILLGGVPPALQTGDGDAAGQMPPAVAALREAVRAGLHVLIQSIDELPAERSWTAVFGLEPQATPTPQPLALQEHLWPELYAVAADRRQSREHWQKLGPLPVRTVPPDAGLVLLHSGNAAPLALIQREAGLVIHDGLPPFATLREHGTIPLVNRLLANLLTLAVRPFWEETPGGVRYALFPPQPVPGTDCLLAMTGGGPAAGTCDEGVELTADGTAGGFTRFAVEWDETVRTPRVRAVRFLVGAAEIERLTARPLRAEDFRLTPDAAVLQELAEMTGGTHCRLDQLPALAAALRALPSYEQHDTRVYRLWHGPWSLALLLAAVTAEYLLRRRAGRVM
jgi:hypothetical protein